jgi:hypothetical protein
VNRSRRKVLDALKRRIPAGDMPTDIGASGAALRASLGSLRKAHPDGPVRRWTDAELREIAGRTDDPIGATVAFQILGQRKREAQPS